MSFFCWVGSLQRKWLRSDSSPWELKLPSAPLLGLFEPGSPLGSVRRLGVLSACLLIIFNNSALFIL